MTPKVQVKATWIRQKYIWFRFYIFLSAYTTNLFYKFCNWRKFFTKYWIKCWYKSLFNWVNQYKINNFYLSSSYSSAIYFNYKENNNHKNTFNNIKVIFKIQCLTLLWLVSAIVLINQLYLIANITFLVYSSKKRIVIPTIFLH